ncbi:MAG: ketoacyl-ACP synthase III [Oligoflexia bacterium]|nr:ketoacyl-ACP synthase III [Oligoflexia bacterium]
MARVLGTGHAVPRHVVTNADLTAFMETSDEWIQQRSGIRERRWSRQGFATQGEARNVDLALEALHMALSSAKIDSSALDAVVYATITPDEEFPGSGVLLQELLAPAKAVPVFEVRNHCAGFIYALAVARAYIDSGTYKHVAVIGCELQSTGLLLSSAGRGTAVLFGDGAGAFVLGASTFDQPGIIGIELCSDGAFADKLGVDAPGFARACALQASHFDGEQPLTAPRMEGQLVFKMASQKMPEVIRKVLQKCGLGLENLDVIVPHQANQRIIEMVGRDLGCPEKIISNIARYGNTTAASIPLALSEAVTQGKIQHGQLVCLVSFGAGFSWGAALIRW